MSTEALAGWEFVVWSEEGRYGYSICLHRGSLESEDHVCIGYQSTRELADRHVAMGNEWLAKITPR